jgi:hypothetical protein
MKAFSPLEMRRPVIPSAMKDTSHIQSCWSKGFVKNESMVQDDQKLSSVVERGRGRKEKHRTAITRSWTVMVLECEVTQ